MPSDTPLARVMVIDDDDINNFLCKKVIGIHDPSVAVDTFIHAKDALAYLQQHKDDLDFLPDLIMLDINMPIINGWEFLEAYKELGLLEKKPMRVAILSSSVYQKDKEKANSYGEVVSFISKPLTLDRYKDLLSKV